MGLMANSLVHHHNLFRLLRAMHGVHIFWNWVYFVRSTAVVFFILLSVSGDSQTLVITGKVLDQDGLPLIGANLAVKNTSAGTFTNLDGQFLLNANRGDTLVISFLGYFTVFQHIDSTTYFEIVLQPGTIDIDDLVVTGYTTQRKKEITGSVFILNPTELNKSTAGQFEQMIQGKVPGLQVVTSGMPGGKSNIYMHGIGNFGEVTPLYIIDGIQGNINNLQPGDIESIQVLKDAGSFSMYGVRGANGVIVITTKKGKPGRTTIQYDTYSGIQIPVKGPDLLNAQEMAELSWMALKNSGQVGPDGNPVHIWYGNGTQPVLPDFLIAGPFRGIQATAERANADLYNLDFTAGDIYQIVAANKKGTDWFGTLFKPAFSQSHGLTVSGGSEKNKHLLSLGYLDQQGTLLHTYLRRITARINTSFTISDRIRLGENLQLSSRENPQIIENVSDNAIFRSFSTEPILPVYDIQGGWASFRPDDINLNPVAQRTLSKEDKATGWEIFGNAWAEADIIEHLTIRSRFGGTLNHSYDFQFGLQGYTGNKGRNNNSFSESSGFSTAWTWTNSLEYERWIKSNHHIKGFIGIEAIRNYSREVGGRRTGLFSNDPAYRFLTNGNPANQTNYSSAVQASLYSFISRLDYGYRDKYFIGITLRNDGSSVFGPKTRFGWFPSVSAAWRIKEEKFLKKLNGVSELKLRGSWGLTGYFGNTNPLNQFTLYGGNAGDASYDIFGTSNSVVQGFRATITGEPATGWQEDEVMNAGLEGTLWEGKLNFILDWYSKESKGLLFPGSLPDILGGAQPPNVNIGNVQNSGVDFMIGAKGKMFNNWNGEVSLHGNVNRNRILKLNDLPYFESLFVRNEVGHPISSFYGYQVIGYFENTEEVSSSPVQQDAAPGRFKYLDADQNGIINDRDRIHFGHANPDFTLGLNLGFNIKNLDFSTFFYGSFGNEVINVSRALNDIFPAFPGSANTAKSKKALYDSWTPQRMKASAPIVENNFNFSNVGVINSYILEDGTYFRNKSIILGYTVSGNQIRKWKMEKLRIYLQASNLFTMTSYSGLDPEISGQSSAYGIDFGNYPNNQKQFLLGLNVGF